MKGRITHRAHRPHRTDADHQLAEALIHLRLNFKALLAVTDEDEAIARLSGLSIHRTPLHALALAKVCEATKPALRACFNQVIQCFGAVHSADGMGEVISALRAIRTCLERVEQHLKDRPFTNDSRMNVAALCAQASDLCWMTIRASGLATEQSSGEAAR